VSSHHTHSGGDLGTVHPVARSRSREWADARYYLDAIQQRPPCTVVYVVGQRATTNASRVTHRGVAQGSLRAVRARHASHLRCAAVEDIDHHCVETRVHAEPDIRE
jgi:hypothetical protein